MALGVLEPREKKVPGTANVLDQEWKRDPTLKRDKTGTIILVPQPSEDPNDPLVRAAHKYICLFLIKKNTHD
jgi:hypothetical protein